MPLITALLLLTEIVAFWGIWQVVREKTWKWKLAGLYGVLSLACISVWLYAFSVPEKIRHTIDYSFFYMAIFCVVTNFIPKALLSFFVLLSLPLNLLRNKRAAPAVILCGLILASGVLLSVIYGFVAGKKTIRTENVSIAIPSLPPVLQGLKVAHISDFHLAGFSNTRFMNRLVEQVNRQNADLILFTGDMVNNFHQEIDGFEHVLSGMQARYGKFAVLGNHDYGDYSDWKSPEDKKGNLEAIKSKIRACGFRLLLNEAEKIRVRDTSVYIIGVENWGHPPFPQYARLKSALEQVPENSFQILMSHDPAHWEDQVLRQTPVPLTLSGHSHGGQFGLKVAGLEFSPIWLVGRYWGGLYQENGQYLYVNRGAGCVGFPARIDMAPEITVLRLVAGK